MTDQESSEQKVELLFRNGTLTVAGIMLAFSLNFITQWASNPLPWTLIDLPTLAMISAGILIQAVALTRFLGHDSVVKRKFDRANSIFVVGVFVTAVGAISAIVIDFLQLIN
ncbi:hypothetical protein [Devosia faecipullorum]|uniref:hypothetical protein n=1 Tax=Devosia faecipullorum TaxID=2755039 RepID=UPI00187B25E2|nr:hypothetical protein [Devosia faecipullorum]MBE7731566.1 hypothetical protein [Devosia faecipullorum]